MTGATGNDYLQLLFIYLFRRYLVPGLRKGRKAIFIFFFFQMGLPSTDNVPVLFPLSWISHATKCAGNAKCSLFFQPDTNKIILYLRNETIMNSSSTLTDFNYIDNCRLVLFSSTLNIWFLFALENLYEAWILILQALKSSLAQNIEYIICDNYDIVRNITTSEDSLYFITSLVMFPLSLLNA